MINLLQLIKLECQESINVLLITDDVNKINAVEESFKTEDIKTKKMLNYHIDNLGIKKKIYYISSSLNLCPNKYIKIEDSIHKNYDNIIIDIHQKKNYCLQDLSKKVSKSIIITKDIDFNKENFLIEKYQKFTLLKKREKHWFENNNKYIHNYYEILLWFKKICTCKNIDFFLIKSSCLV